MPQKKEEKEQPKKRGRPKQGNNKRHFKKELSDIINFLENGASYSMVKNYFGMSNSEWTSFYNDNEISIKQARAKRQLSLISKTNDLAINHNNFNALRMLLINETELQDKVEQKIDTVQAVNIVDNTEQIEDIKTFGEKNDKE